ncbi:hypothetical protein Mycch_5362 (plasmid) [Mycolicibacterium chubuense NBB4]|uniref:RES domain protein n=1 Tax=Mycolicibacterium chubuense (strain NBB4) TaxID=710421 RepID=I4BRY2_MYCCN|nr:hypothetical protein Mycch_5362 [Mycolicibacterium chubuense NBB4]
MAPLSRQRLGLRKPAADITGFPVRRLRRQAQLYRAHHRAFGAWWFASDPGGRFNLAAPNSTCYLAADEETALRERLGPTAGVVSYGWADETRVSVLEVQRGGRVADTCHPHAPRFGMTREVATYARPQLRSDPAVGKQISCPRTAWNRLRVAVHHHRQTQRLRCVQHRRRQNMARGPQPRNWRGGLPARRPDRPAATADRHAAPHSLTPPLPHPTPRCRLDVRVEPGESTIP